MEEELWRRLVEICKLTWTEKLVAVHAIINVIKFIFCKNE